MLNGSPAHTRGAHAPPGFLLASPSRAHAAAWRGARAFSCLLALIHATLCPWRAAFASDPEKVEHIVVKGKVPTRAEREAPTAFISMIDPADRPGEVQTTAELLSEAVGVQVRRFGGLGAFSTVSIRGSSANQVQVYLDGIPLSRARNNVVDLSGLPVDSLERIEVYRGTAPLEFSGGIGGVVNLVTQPASEAPQTELAASYGSFDTRKVVASRSQRLLGTDLLGYVTYLGSDGDFRFQGRPETPGAPANASVSKTRINNGFDSVDAILKGTRSLDDDFSVDLTSEFYFRDGGVPGDENDQAKHASLRQWRSLNYLRLRHDRLFTDRLDAEASLFGVYEREEFVDDTSPPELGFFRQDRCDQDTLVGGNLSATYWPFEAQSLAWFAELSHEQFSGFNAAATGALRDEPDQTRLSVALALQPRIELFDSRLLVVPTNRYEHLRDSVSSLPMSAGQPAGERETNHTNLWSPSIGAQLVILPHLKVRGNLGRFQRAPTFVELFGNRGTVRGNPDLDPEDAVDRDVGLVFDLQVLRWLSELHLEYAYFNNDVDDVIVLVQTSQNVFRPRNVGKARIRGHEVDFRATFLDHLALSLNYTNQDPEIRSGSQKGNRLPGRPGDELYLRTELFNDLGKVFYEFNLVGDNYLGEGNIERVPTRYVHTIGITTTFPDWVTVGFEARNITDDQINDVLGFPLPGLSFFGTVRVKL